MRIQACTEVRLTALVLVLLCAPGPPAAAQEEPTEEAWRERADSLVARHEGSDASLDLDVARGDLEEARKLYAQLGDPHREALTVFRLAQVYGRQGDQERAFQLMLEVPDLLEHGRDWLGLWALETAIAGVLLSKDAETAEEHLERGLEALDALLEDSTPISTEALSRIAGIADQKGLLEQLEMIAPMLDVARPMVIPLFKGTTWLMWAQASRRAGQLDRAEEALDTAADASGPLGLLDEMIAAERQKIEKARSGAEPAAPRGPAPDSSTETPRRESSGLRAETDEVLSKADGLLFSLSGEVLGNEPQLQGARILRALEIYRQADHPPGQLASLLLLGRLEPPGSDRALARYEEMLKLAQEKGEAFDLWLAHANLATARRDRGEPELALEHLETALARAETARHEVEISSLESLFLTCGVVDCTHGVSRAQARRFLEQLLVVMRGERPSPLFTSGIGRKGLESALETLENGTRGELANVLLDLQRPEEARAHLAETPTLPHNSFLAARARLRQTDERSRSLRELYLEELSVVEESWPLLPSWLTDYRAQPSWLNPLNPTLLKPFDLSHWYQALDIARRNRHHGQEVEILLRLGRDLGHQGRGDEAEAILREALEKARRLSRKDLEAEVLEGLAYPRMLVSDYEGFIRHSEQALTLYRELGDVEAEARLLSLLSSMLMVFGLLEPSIEAHREAGALPDGLPDSQPWDDLQPKLARVVDLLVGGGDPLAAAEILLPEDPELVLPEMTLLHRAFQPLRTDFGAPGGMQLAMARTRRHLVEAKRSEDFLLQLSGSIQLAELLRREGRCAEALIVLEELLDLLQVWPGWNEHEAAVQGGIAALRWELGDDATAIALLRRSVAQLDEIAARSQTSQLSVELPELRRYHLYRDLLIHLLARRGEAAEAFEQAERGRARAFLDRLGDRRLDLARLGDPELLGRLEDLRQRLRQLDEELSELRGSPGFSPFGSRAAELADERERTRVSYEHLLLRAELLHPEYASLVRAEAIPLEELRESVLEEGVSLLAYHSGPRQTFAWRVSHDAFEMVTLQVGRTELELAVDRWRDLVHLRSPAADELAAELHRRLVADLLPSLGDDRLVIVPHGPLHLLPFAALRDAETGRYLAESHELSLAPSASSLRHLRRRRGTFENRALVLGDADGSLPHAAEEARTVARLFGTAAHVGSEASESLLYREAAGIDVLHVAARGRFDSSRPGFSRLVLAGDSAEDGHLELHEVVERLDLHEAELVVLSACETGLGRITRGDELTGLGRAFLVAGAGAVISTLWRVDDAASAALVEAFYRHFTGSLEPAQALSAAQREVMAQEGRAAPYYWAGFTLSGG